MDINREDQSSESTQYQKAFLNYVENEQSTKHRRFHLTERESIPSNNVISSANAPRSGQSGQDPCDLSNNDEELIMSIYVAERTPG